MALLLALIDEYLVQSLQVGIGGKFLLTLFIVVLPVLALCLWRAGLLPPERVEVEEDVP